MEPIASLLEFLRDSPSPYHAARNVSALLGTAGSLEVDPSQPLPGEPGTYHVVLGGTLIAWSGDPAHAATGAGVRIAGAHTDSPNLRIKPLPDLTSGNTARLEVEVYGSPLLNSWLDRDLGLSGRVQVVEDTDPVERLVCDHRPLLRIPQLAVHLDREVNSKGLLLNPQVHLNPLWSAGPAANPSLRSWLATTLDTDVDRIVTWDLMLHDVAPPMRTGHDGSLISSGRIDNLVSCWAVTQALINSSCGVSDQQGPVRVIALFDHEEVGSTSSSGANSAVLASLLERIVIAGGGDREAFLRCLANSSCISADGAHATNPNYPDRHDPSHQIGLNEGPVIKHNASMRYATDSRSAAAFVLACRDAGIPLQQFVSRNDIPCGSTIGPAISANLGVSTVDVGVAQLSMHSAREVCGTLDPPRFARALAAFFDAP